MKAILSLIIMCSFFSCVQVAEQAVEEVTGNNPAPEAKVEESNIGDFDFSTNQDLDMVAEVLTDFGEPVPYTRVKIYTSKGGEYLASYMTDEYGEFNLEMPVPGHLEKVYIEYTLLGMRSGEYLEI